MRRLIQLGPIMVVSIFVFGMAPTLMLFTPVSVGVPVAAGLHYLGIATVMAFLGLLVIPPIVRDLVRDIN